MFVTRHYIDHGIARSEAGIPEAIPQIEGYSSDKIRRLLNWLCKLEGANYLELGIHLGSTFIPALWQNKQTPSTGIENWSLTGNLRTRFDANAKKHLGKRSINLVEGDMMTVDLAKITKGINVYFVDGPHDEAAHYEAFARFNPVLADRFVVLIDDWRWEEVRHGTNRAFGTLGYRIEAQWELPARNERDAEQWWNILFVAIINKRQ